MSMKPIDFDRRYGELDQVISAYLGQPADDEQDRPSRALRAYLRHAWHARPGPRPSRSSSCAGAAYEQKLDGHRALLFTAAGPGGTVLVQTRRGALVKDRWPDLAAAAEA